MPAGEGILAVTAPPATEMQPLVVVDRGGLRRVWWVSLASHLDDRRVASRMIDAAREVLAADGVTATIDECSDDTSVQPGAAFALFAEFDGGVRLGADGAGARGRPAEEIGRRVARSLLDVIRSAASVDRFTADQCIVFSVAGHGHPTAVPRSPLH